MANEGLQTPSITIEPRYVPEVSVRPVSQSATMLHGRYDGEITLVPLPVEIQLHTVRS